MVAHLEREMELNGLANPETNSITGINNVEFQQTEQQPERKKGTCDYCGNQGHFKHQCRKLKNDQRNNTRQGPRRAITTCETYGEATKQKNASQAQTGPTDPTGGEHPNRQETPTTNQ